MQRRPRKRPAPVRTRLKSGSVIENASPTITYSTRPLRPTSTPTCRPQSCEISASWRANSWVRSRSRGSLRLYRFVRRRSWLALSPYVWPCRSEIRGPLAQTVHELGVAVEERQDLLGRLRRHAEDGARHAGIARFLDVGAVRAHAEDRDLEAVGVAARVGRHPAQLGQPAEDL